MIRKHIKNIAAALAVVALLGFAVTGGAPRKAFADFDWSALIVQWEARTPNIGTYPPGATPLSNSSGNVAAGTATASLPAGGAGITTYITGWDVNGGGATGAALINCAVTGPTNSEARTFAVAAGATALSTPLSVRYPAPIPASAANTSIGVSCPSFGSGNTNATVNAYGFSIAKSP